MTEVFGNASPAAPLLLAAPGALPALGPGDDQSCPGSPAIPAAAAGAAPSLHNSRSPLCTIPALRAQFPLSVHKSRSLLAQFLLPPSTIPAALGDPWAGGAGSSGGRLKSQPWPCWCGPISLRGLRGFSGVSRGIQRYPRGIPEVSRGEGSCPSPSDPSSAAPCYGIPSHAPLMAPAALGFRE